MPTTNVIVPAFDNLSGAHELWADTGLAVKAGQPVKITATGSMTWTEGADPIGPNGDPILGTEEGVYPPAQFCALIGCIASTADPQQDPSRVLFSVGASLNFSASRAGKLFLGINDNKGTFGDNTGNYVATVTTAITQGAAYCPVGYTGRDDRVGPTIPSRQSIGAALGSLPIGVPLSSPPIGVPLSSLPIGVPLPLGGQPLPLGGQPLPLGIAPVSLLIGEKREEITGLSVTTPAGPLTFSHFYRQGRLSDPNYQFMGLGWAHNHRFMLTATSGTPNTVTVWLNGSSLVFSETASGSNLYVADPGSASTVTWNSGTSQYTLTAMDESTYVFNSSGRLVSRSWPSNESWTYSYDGSNRLTSVVDDGYSLDGGMLKRKLEFRYYTSGPFNGQLYRVGDHTFDDTNPSAPTGRYVEFGYTASKIVNSSGAIVSGSSSTDSMLTSIRDVRGNTWTYTYYGQNASETDQRLLNYLTSQQSPAVDSAGSGFPRGPITLKKLTYTPQSTELAADGGMELPDGSTPWISVGTPPTNTRSTTQVHSGTYARRVVTNAANQGIAGNAWSMVAGRTYQITAWVYPITGTVKMQVANATTLNRTSTGVNAWELLRLVHTPTRDLEAGSLQFLVTTSSGEFYVDTVSIAEVTLATLVEQQGEGALRTAFAFQPGGEPITTEITAGQTLTHYFDNDVYVATQDAAGHRATETPDGQFRPGVQTDANGNQTRLVWSGDGKLLQQVTDALGNATQFTYNANSTLKTSQDAEGRQTQYTYGDATNPRLPTRVQVVDIDGLTVLSWQEFSYDAKGRPLTARTFDPASNGTKLEQETTLVYYTSGNGNGLLQTVTQKDLRNAANNVSQTLFYDSLGRLVRTKQGLTFGSCTHSLSLYDAAGNVLASVCNYDPDGNTDPTTVAQLLARYNPAFPDKNRITLHTYDSLGRRVATTTDAGAPYAQTTLTAYDSLHRVTRTIANYVANPAIPDPLTHRQQEFAHGPHNDQNLVTDTLYNERSLVRAQVDVLGTVTLFGYDEADTLVKTIHSASQPTYDNTYAPGGDPSLRRYVASSAPDLDIITTHEYDAAGNRIKTTDAVGSVTLIGYDALNRPVRTVRSASQPTYNLKADPTLSQYVASSDPDQDLMDFTEYDALGRVRRSQDVAGNWTLFGYDGLGRAVKTIRAASQPTYDIARDPSLRNYVASSVPDQDIVTETAHDPAGRVMYTADVLGRRTWTGYDGLGRAVRTITNAVGQATDGGGKDPRSTGYNAVIDFSDRDLIAQTAFDSNGYVLWTQDPLGNKTWLVHDSVGRQVKAIVNATGAATDGGAHDPRSARYIPGSASDQDIVTETLYDGQGRVVETVDPLGNRTRYHYDALGRRIKTMVNLVTGTFNANRPDLDLTSTTTYDVAGRVITTTDVRGTQATFTYDRAGRQLTRTEAARTSLARTSYTCYDKAGRVLRTIQNWIADPTQAPPDARDPQGNWLFNPVSHGAANDQNLITTFTLDKLGRPIQVSDPLGNLTQMAYARDGQVESRTNALVSVTKYRYDRLRRRTLVVQAYNASTFTDPASWYWDDAVGQKKWKDGKGTAITFGAANDRNLIVQVEYDKAGRLTALRDPRGNRTTTAYDLLDRRTALTNPLGQTWTTAYANRNGIVRTTQTNPLGHVTQHDSDHARRLVSVKYLDEDPKFTPDVTFTYDRAGNRTAMHEVADGSTVRNTTFRYDHAHRLVEVTFDVYGDGLTIEVVTYQYDAGGLHTKVTRPDDESITYSYNARGELSSLTNWLSQTTQFTYDGIGRLATIVRSGITSTYGYDAASRLTSLSHTSGMTTLASFAYTLNALGNRTGVVETQAQAPSGSDTHNVAYAYDALARLTQAIHRTGGTLGSGTLVRQDDYAFDVAGNRTQQQVNTGGGPTTTNYTYDAANRLTSDGSHSFTYDAAGRMTGDGQSGFSYIWDRASRLLSFGDNFALYNGLDQRVEYTVDVIPPVTTRYVPDMQGGLWTVLASDTDNDVMGYVHGPTGLLQQVDPGGASHWLLPDGQGNVRGVVNNSATVEESRLFSPYGQGYGFTGSIVTKYGYTGEPTNENGLVYLRARHYHPTFGVFPNLDPLEGEAGQPLSLNRYGYVQGNVVNLVDPSGLCIDNKQDCLAAVEELEKEFGPRVYIYWRNRNAPKPAVPSSGVFEGTIPITATPTSCPTPPGATPTMPPPTSTGVNQLSGLLRTPQGWTTEEVRTIKKGLEVLGKAHKQNFNVTFVRSSTEPTGRTIGNNTNLSIHPYGANITILLGNTWSSLLKDQQYGKWVVVHESNHAFLWDRFVALGPYSAFGQKAYETFVTKIKDPTKRRFPTKYAADNYDTGTEFIAEGMTGLVWDIAKEPFATVADHRYASEGVVPPGGVTYPYNVKDIPSFEGVSLRDWIVQELPSFITS